MASLFPNCPEALENTAKIADMCNVEFEFGKYHLPHFQLPDGWTDGDAYFEKLCMDGFRWRYPAEPPEYLEKLRYEMGMIRKMGFVDYFLIVSDFIAYAKNHGIPVGPGRGSAAGSMVSYCLNITDLDPVKYNLYFERFLNPERVTMPDIDIDFPPPPGGHRLCLPEVRGRPCGPDRHLRHHGRPGGGAGRGPGAEHDLR